MKTNLGPGAIPERSATLGFLLRELYDELQQRVYAAVAADGHPDLREMHSPVLRHLPKEGARVADLARRTGLAKQSVTYIVEDLSRLGYVAVASDPDDGRAKRVRFTSRGRSLVASLLSQSEAAERELGRKIGKARLSDLRTSLELAVAGFVATGIG